MFMPKSTVGFDKSGRKKPSKNVIKIIGIFIKSIKFFCDIKIIILSLIPMYNHIFLLISKNNTLIV